MIRDMTYIHTLDRYYVSLLLANIVPIVILSVHSPTLRNKLHIDIKMLEFDL